MAPCHGAPKSYVSPPRVHGPPASGCEDLLALLPQLALIGHRLWETAALFHLRDAFRPATSGWRGRAATAPSERRCCRLPPSLMLTAACWLRPVRTTWLAERRTETAVPAGAADLGRRPLPADARGAAGPTSRPLGWEHINLTGEYRWPGADPSGTAKRLA